MRRVVSRFLTYGVEVPAPVRSYMDRMMALPAMRDWLKLHRQKSMPELSTQEHRHLKSRSMPFRGRTAQPRDAAERADGLRRCPTRFRPALGWLGNQGLAVAGLNQCARDAIDQRIGLCIARNPIGARRHSFHRSVPG